ncbi:MAG: hypothetical protein HY460_03270 [Parcubacteria group bacterium]|nr:hypothetical protein [Parcubacteria group bacterium]
MNTRFKKTSAVIFLAMALFAMTASAAYAARLGLRDLTRLPGRILRTHVPSPGILIPSPFPTFVSFPTLPPTSITPDPTPSPRHTPYPFIIPQPTPLPTYLPTPPPSSFSSPIVFPPTPTPSPTPPPPRATPFPFRTSTKNTPTPRPLGNTTSTDETLALNQDDHMVPRAFEKFEPREPDPVKAAARVPREATLAGIGLLVLTTGGYFAHRWFARLS